MNAIAPVSQSAVRPVLTPSTFEQLVRFAELAAQSGMVPKDYINKPGAIMVACQMGGELGLSPMQSINSIAVINGRPGVFGDALIGICRQSPLCQDIVETIEGTGETRTAVCVATRRGASPTTARFSVADAKKAGLWGKVGPWTQYPDRMLQMRARSFACRDAFPDLLRGLKAVEELTDIPRDDYRGTTIEAQPERTPNQPRVSETVPQPKEGKRTYRQLLDETAGMVAACDGLDGVEAIGAMPAVQYALANANAEVKREMNAILSAGIHRWRTDPDPGTAESVADEAEADFHGDRP
jgi:hypothetical protein